MHQWRSEPINAIDRLSRWKRRREVEVGVGERDSKGNMGKDSRGWAAVPSSGLVFLLMWRKRRGWYLWSERTRFPPSEMPHGSVAEDTLTESRADYLPRGSVHAVVVVVGGVGVWVGGRGGGLIGEDAAHPSTLPFMHIISLSWGWVALGTQQHSSSHRWFGIVMRSQGWKVSMHARLHLFSQESYQCVCVCVCVRICEDNFSLRTCIT